MVHAVISPDWRSIELELAWNESELVKLIPGTRYSGRDKAWRLPLSWASMCMLRGVFGVHFTYSQDLADWTWNVKNTRVDVALSLRDTLDAPVNTADELSERMYAFQRADVRFMRAAVNGLLGNEAGTGKTISILSFIREIELDRALGWEAEVLPALPALVICPNSVKHHWRKRTLEWCPAATPYVLEKGTVGGRKIIAQAREDPTALVIMNFDAVKAFSRLAPYGSVKLKRCRLCDPKFGDDIRSSQCNVHPKELNDFPFHSVFVDEAHRIGSPTTQQTRAAWMLAHAPGVYYRWTATGTPDHVKRLWSIMHTVAPDEYGTRSKWLDRYGLVSWNAFGGAEIVGMRPDTREEAYRVLDPRFRRMLKAVVLPQLPPKVRQIRYAEMPPAQKKMYDDLKSHLFTRLPDGQLFITQNTLVARTRMMQFASGAIELEKPDEDDVSTWKVHIREPSTKLDVMEEVIEELGRRPFVVACMNRDVVGMVSLRLEKKGIRHELIVGGVRPEDSERYTQELKDGSVQALVFTTQAGGVGLDMSGADTMIFVQRSWSLIDDIQTEERAHRIGSEIHECINVIDIVTRDTIEEDQIEKLHNKLNQLDEITRDRARLAKLMREGTPTSAEYAEMTAKMVELTTRQQQIMDDAPIELEQEEV